jgi:hypothetical protein
VSPEHSRAARFQGAALLPEGVLNTWGAAPGASGDVAFFLDSAGAQLFPYDVGQDAWGRPIGLGLGGDAGVGAARLVVGPEGLVVVTGAPAGDVVLVDPASRRVTGRIQAPRCPR